MELTLWDLGGQDKLRSMWKHYFGGVQGIIFVVDASDVARLELAGQELSTCLRDESLANSAVLVLCNKQDLPGAKSDEEVTKLMGLDAPDGATLQLVGTRPLKVCGSSAMVRPFRSWQILFHSFILFFLALIEKK